MNDRANQGDAKAMQCASARAFCPGHDSPVFSPIRSFGRAFGRAERGQESAWMFPAISPA
jgi:hypothetical protein